MILGKDNVWRLPQPVGTSDWASFCVTRTASTYGFYDEMCSFMRVFLAGR